MSKEKDKTEKNDLRQWSEEVSKAFCGLLRGLIWVAIVIGILVFIFNTGIRMNVLTYLDDEILSGFGIRITPGTYYKNEIIEIDDLSYIVGGHISTEKTIGLGINSPPNATYLVINIDVENIGKKAKEIPEFKLIDENGKIYDSAINNTTKLNPEVKSSILVVFDVTVNHKYRLIISNSKSKPKAYVNLDE